MIARLRRPAATSATVALALGALLALPARGARAQDTRPDFTWSGTVEGDAWVRIRNINGAIRVEPGEGNRVEVTAVKRVRRGDPESVRIVAARTGTSGRDVLVCALWNENATCDENGYSSGERRSRWNNDNNVEVEFTVKLPKGARVAAKSVNGSVRVRGATSEVEVETVNGGVEASSLGGPVRASTVNGNIDVAMSTLGTGDIEYETVNGSVTVTLPELTDADVELQTVNGSLTSDFPLTVQGRIDRRHVRARIGKGGRNLSFSTVNGSVHLARR